MSVKTRHPYPLADRLEGVSAAVAKDVRALWTGQTRPPQKGEWYLSGAVIEAYQAKDDLTTSYPIARLVSVESRPVFIPFPPETPKSKAIRAAKAFFPEIPWNMAHPVEGLVDLWVVTCESDSEHLCLLINNKASLLKVVKRS